jgi:hypothetical protein
MHATRNAAKALTHDVKAVEWLPLSKAIERLSLPHEQHLRNVGRHALKKTCEPFCCSFERHSTAVS